MPSPSCCRAPISRRYRILLGADPAFAVNEWFLETVIDVWDRRPPG